MHAVIGQQVFPSAAVKLVLQARKDLLDTQGQSVLQE